tara:strand:+ start:1047 stop:1208 length:162 start_codon:yes stop_codon:yes gene_type:complete
MTFKKDYWKKRNKARKQEAAYKPSSKETQEESPQAEGSSFKPKSTSSRIRDPE